MVEPNLVDVDHWDPSVIHWGRKMDKRIGEFTGTLIPKLAEDERLLAVFGSNAVSPMIDFVALTSARVVAGTRSNLAKTPGFAVSLPATTLASVRFNWADTAEVTLQDGSKRKVGTIHKEDHGALTSVIQYLASTPPPAEVYDQIGTADSKIGFNPPDGPHLGMKLDGSAVRDATQSSVWIANEVLNAAFGFRSPGPREPQLLLVSNVRVLGVRTEAQVVQGVWSLRPSELSSFSISDLGKVQVVLSSGSTISCGTVRVEDRAALQHYLMHFSETNQEEAGPDDGLPLPFRESLFGTTSVALRNGDGAGELVRGQVVEGEVVSYSSEMTDAIGSGFPEKDVRLVEPILAELESAQKACNSREIVEEERRIAKALQLAGTAGLARRGKARRWVEQQVQRRVSAGRLRRNVEVVGVVGRSLQIFNDRILHESRCYVLDEDVSASVEVDGQILESSRPTLTRMAVGSVLPGTALIVGMALPKKTREDNRTASFHVVHPRWRISESLDPDKAASTRGIAAQINALADRQRRRPTETPAAVPALPTPAQPTDAVADQLDQLERIASMEASGALTADQANVMRAKILGG